MKILTISMLFKNTKSLIYYAKAYAGKEPEAKR